MINFTYEEIIYDLAGNEFEATIQKINNDSRFSSYEQLLFFKEEDLEAIKKDYPVFVEIEESGWTYTFDEFLERVYGSGKDLEIYNGLTIEEDFLFDIAQSFADYGFKDTTTFCEQFLNNPSQRLEQLKEEVIQYCVSFKLGQLLKSIKDKGIKIDQSVINDAQL